MKRFGRYELLGEIGHGGAAVVFRARDPDGRIVAIKLLRRVGKDAISRWDRERRLLDSFCEADGIVPLLDSSADPPFVVLPFLDGGTLRTRLQRGPLSVDAAVGLVERLARALGRAHEKGIIHRDVKPENVLFDAHGTALLADFGLAKHFDDSTPGASQSIALSTTGEMRGTAGYMAPEQVNGARKVGPEADVFALGAVLYECLAGIPAFHGEELLEVLDRATRARFDPLSRHRKDVPPWLAKVVTRALSREPQKRFPDGHALAAALRAGPPPPGAAGPRGLLIAGLLVTVGLAVVLVYLVRERAKRAATALAVAQADTAFARSDMTVALARFTEALDLAPGDAALRTRRGEARLALGDGKGAREDFERAVAVAPSPRVFMDRSRACLLLGERERAIEDATRAVTLAPRSAEAWAYRGSLRPAADHTAREADFDQAASLEPRNGRYLVLRGLERLRLARNESALKDAKAASELDPSLALAWEVLGELARADGDPNRARSLLERSLQIDPSSADAHTSLGLAYWDLSRLDQALAQFTKAIDLGPPNAVALASRAELRLSGPELAGAIDDADRALALENDSWRALYARAAARSMVAGKSLETGRSFEAASSDFKTALADIERAARLEPGAKVSRLERAYIRRLLGDFRGAVEDTDFVLATDKLNATAFSNRAAAHLYLEDYDAAIADAQVTIALVPTWGFGYAFRGLARLKLGQREAARSDLTRALELEIYGPDKLAAQRALAGF